MKLKFFEVSHCTARTNCGKCRNTEVDGYIWREAILNVFDAGTDVNFDCPYGVPWKGPKPTNAVQAKVEVAFKKTLLEKASSVIRAIVTGDGVSAERRQKRVEVCAGCELVKLEGDGILRCGICNCKLQGTTALINLARYEETEFYGCKYPGGSRWRANGV